MHRFFLPAVVRELPFGGIGIKSHFQGKFGQPRFDVARGRGGIAGAHIAPVALRVDHQFLLSHIDQRIADGGVAVGMKLHGVADDVGHLMVAAVVHAFHGMQNAPLYRFQPVEQSGYGAFHNNVRGIIQKPVFVQAGHMNGALG